MKKKFILGMIPALFAIFLGSCEIVAKSSQDSQSQTGVDNNSTIIESKSEDKSAEERTSLTFADLKDFYNDFVLEEYTKINITRISKTSGIPDMADIESNDSFVVYVGTADWNQYNSLNVLAMISALEKDIESHGYTLEKDSNSFYLNILTESASTTIVIDVKTGYVTQTMAEGAIHGGGYMDVSMTFEWTYATEEELKAIQEEFQRTYDELVDILSKIQLASYTKVTVRVLEEEASETILLNQDEWPSYATYNAETLLDVLKETSNIKSLDITTQMGGIVIVDLVNENGNYSCVLNTNDGYVYAYMEDTDFDGEFERTTLFTWGVATDEELNGGNNPTLPLDIDEILAAVADIEVPEYTKATVTVNGVKSTYIYGSKEWMESELDTLNTDHLEYLFEDVLEETLENTTYSIANNMLTIHVSLPEGYKQTLVFELTNGTLKQLIIEDSDLKTESTFEWSYASDEELASVNTEPELNPIVQEILVLFDDVDVAEYTKVLRKTFSDGDTLSETIIYGSEEWNNNNISELNINDLIDYFEEFTSIGTLDYEKFETKVIVYYKVDEKIVGEFEISREDGWLTKIVAEKQDGGFEQSYEWGYATDDELNAVGGEKTPVIFDEITDLFANSVKVEYTKLTVVGEDGLTETINVNHEDFQMMYENAKYEQLLAELVEMLEEDEYTDVSYYVNEKDEVEISLYSDDSTVMVVTLSLYDGMVHSLVAKQNEQIISSREFLWDFATDDELKQ